MSELPPGVRQLLPRRQIPELAQFALEARPRELWLSAIQELGKKRGFARLGIADAEADEESRKKLEHWLSQGFHGEMDYLEAPARHAPSSLSPNVRSVLVVCLPYAGFDDRRSSQSSSEGSSELTAEEENHGRVARYAWGADYHHVLKLALLELAQDLADVFDQSLIVRPCVDTAPLLERQWAQRAGVAFQGKNTLSIAPGLGSYFLLGELLLDIELPSGTAIAEGCGQCTRCLDACPTGAFLSPFVMDARRCISYLNIELKGDIPRELRSKMGRMVFGCDICQEVCPFNQSAYRKEAAELLQPRPGISEPNLIELLELGSAAYKRFVKGSSMNRVSRDRLARNAAIALGNSRPQGSKEALLRCVQTHKSAMVRRHAIWALSQFSASESQDIIEANREQWLKEAKTVALTSPDLTNLTPFSQIELQSLIEECDFALALLAGTSSAR